MSLIAPVCVLLKEVRAGDLDLIVIVCGSIVLFALVVMRMADLVRQQERSVTRERLLSSSGTALVSCTTREEMQQAGSGGGRPTARGSRGGDSLPDRGGRSLAAVGLNGDAEWPPRTLPGQVSDRLLEFAADDGSQELILEPEMLAALDLPTEWDLRARAAPAGSRRSPRRAVAGAAQARLAPGSGFPGGIGNSTRARAGGRAPHREDPPATQ